MEVTYLPSIGREAWLSGYDSLPEDRICLQRIAALEDIKQYFRNDKILLFIDSSIIDAEEYREFFQNNSSSLFCVSLEVHEGIKSAEYAENKINFILSQFVPTSIVVVGGGTLINLTTWIVSKLCSTYSSNIANYIIIPSTLLALGDVAYGSKGNLNNTIGKHRERLYQDPTHIILLPSLFSSLADENMLQDLAESLKHALLQDKPPLSKLLSAVKSADKNAAYELACETIFAKQDILIHDKHESTWIAYVLSYGHLHAHAFEQASDYTLTHAQAVLFGILCDLKLAGNAGIFDIIFPIISSALKKVVPIIKSVLTNKDMEEYYRSNAKEFMIGSDQDFLVLPLSTVGQYAQMEMYKEIPLVGFSFGKISDVLKTILNLLEDRI